MGPRKRFQFDRNLRPKVGSFNFSIPRGFDSFGSEALMTANCIIASLSSAKTAIMTASCIEEKY